MKNGKSRILMLSAGMISGSFQMMLDIIQLIDKRKFKVFVTYKPDFSEWGKYEIKTIKESETEVVPLRGKALFDIRGYIDLYRVLKIEEIDIVHCWDVLGVPARIICKYLNVRVVVEFANPPPVLFEQISLKHYMINKWSSILVDGYISCSQGVMRRYNDEQAVFMKNKITRVVLNCVKEPGIDTIKQERHDYLGKYNIPDSAKIIVNIGYFSKQKAQQDLLLALKKVIKIEPDVCLLLIGWGKLEKELKEQATILGLSDKVVFTGKLKRKDVFQALSISDLFVLSSHWEGFGIVIAEAMMMQKAVISTATDGAKEVVLDGITGRLVPIGDPAAMSKEILVLLQNRKLRAEMGHNGKRWAEKNFTCEKYIKGYECFYEKVLSRGCR